MASTPVGGANNRRRLRPSEDFESCAKAVTCQPWPCVKHKLQQRRGRAGRISTTNGGCTLDSCRCMAPRSSSGVGREYALLTGRFQGARDDWPLSGGEFEEGADAFRPGSGLQLTQQRSLKRSDFLLSVNSRCSFSTLKVISIGPACFVDRLSSGENIYSPDHAYCAQDERPN